MSPGSGCFGSQAESLDYPARYVIGADYRLSDGVELFGEYEDATGRDIEAIGRLPLWMAGQDFDHGLGHGVGAYLSVHEGPQRLSRISHVPLAPGMILSNEPGYYREGAFGIRIENLIVVEDAPALPGGDAHRAMLQWRTLTFVPIDRRLIVTEMLTGAERRWIDDYHREVAEKITNRVDPEVREWLKKATAPL